MNITSTLSKPKLLMLATVVISSFFLSSFWKSSTLPESELGSFIIAEVAEADFMGRTAHDINFADIYLKRHAAYNVSQKDVVASKTALENNIDLLQKTDLDRAYKVGGLNFQAEDLRTVAGILERALEEGINPEEYLDFHQIAGRDNGGNVFYTGYFAPVIAVRSTKDEVFKYPLYRYPESLEGNIPTRKQIDGKDNVLKGMDLEIAYARNPLDIYFMQVQGSGYIQYEDGKQELLSFDGSNKRSYRSIGKYMIDNGYTTKDKVSINSIRKYFKENPKHVEEILFSNPSYVFFHPGRKSLKGAGQVPLTALHSIAVDPKYIPLGSMLLAKVPIANARGKFTNHEYRLLYAQDTGGSIKGPGRIDIFSGVGYQGKSLAGDTHHYGEMWLLLPKELGIRP